MMKPFLATLVVLGSVLAIIAAGFLVYRADRQAKNAAALEISSASGIAAGRFVTLGGIEQWISIRGEDRANPVLLDSARRSGDIVHVVHAAVPRLGKTLHGRPVGPRGVGQTFGRNGRAGSGEMTLDRIVREGTELAEWLRTELGKQKILLLGHSMGSMIGVSMAALCPDLFYAYVGTEQIVDMPANEQASYEIILERTRRQGNDKAVATLERIGPPPYEPARVWGVKQAQAEVADTAYGAVAGGIGGFLLFSPNYRLRDVASFIGGQIFCTSVLYSQWMEFRARDLGTTFALPVFVVQGADDVMTPTHLAAAWLDDIAAPHKQLVAIPAGGHLVFATAANAYFDVLLTRVRPLAEPVS